MKRKRLLLIPPPSSCSYALVYLCLPFYMRQALIHWYPDISDTYLFPFETVAKSDTCWDFPASSRCNGYRLTPEENAFMEEYGTVSFLVIRNDSVLYEEYRDGWTPATLSNIFSATKSIVGLLVGIALDEGHIASLDDSVGKYLPEFFRRRQSPYHRPPPPHHEFRTGRDEAYTALVSKTTEAYYGNDIRRLVTDIAPVEAPRQTLRLQKR